jgi:hypothetical protein
LRTVKIPQAIARTTANASVRDDYVDAVMRAPCLGRLEHGLLLIPATDIALDKDTFIAAVAVQLLLDNRPALLVHVGKGDERSSSDKVPDTGLAHAVGPARDDDGFPADILRVGTDGVVDRTVVAVAWERHGELMA